MKTKLTAAVLGLGMLGVANVAIAAPNQFRASLDGYQAVPTLSLPGSTANATFSVNGSSSIDYTLNYDTAGDPVQQVHVHLGRPGTAGGVIAFLCSNLGNAPAGTPACPATPATVSGTLFAADIVGPSAQGIAPGEIAEAIAAINAGAVYVVHTNAFPGGSIRGAVVKGGAG
jgi:hypothetical protein